MSKPSGKAASCPCFPLIQDASHTNPSSFLLFHAKCKAPASSNSSATFSPAQQSTRCLPCSAAKGNFISPNPSVVTRGKTPIQPVHRSPLTLSIPLLLLPVSKNHHLLPALPSISTSASPSLPARSTRSLSWLQIRAAERRGISSLALVLHRTSRRYGRFTHPAHHRAPQGGVEPRPCAVPLAQAPLGRQPGTAAGAGSPCRQAALCTSRTGAGTAAVCEGADDAAVAWLMPPLGAAPMEAAPELPWTTT